MPRVTITLPDKTPQPYKFQLDRQLVTIGRGSVNDIAIDCGSVSVKHAEMARIEGGYELRDLGSTNGTKLDGERREVIALRHGLSVKLGDVAFDFQLSDEEREALEREKPFVESPIERDQSPEPSAEAAPARRAAPRKPVVVTETGGGGGFLMFLLFLLFAGIAFFAGLSIRYYKETGGSLFDGIQTRSKTLKAKSEAAKTAHPPPPVPAPTPPPPPTPTPTPRP